MHTLITSIALTLLAGAAPASAETVQLPRIDTQVRIMVGDEVVGMPRVVSTAGESATVSVSGAHGYTLSINASEAPDRSDGLVLALELWLMSDGVLRKAATPMLTVTNGSPASIAIAGAGRSDGGTGDLKIEVLATSVARARLPTPKEATQN